MAITGPGPTSENVSSLQRQKTYTKNDLAPTEYNANADVENVDDNTPAAGQWKFLQSTDEMSAAFTQFYNRRLYEKRLSEVSGNFDYILEDEALDKSERIFEALQNSKSTHRELMDLARELFPDESDLVIVLREFLRRKRISEIIRKKVQALLKEVESQSDQVHLKSGINCALKARLFGTKLDTSPQMLRACYRSFLMSNDSPLETYIEWVSNFGSQKRDSVLVFVEGSLLGDINSLDPSCSNVEFGLMLKKLCHVQSIRSAELLFVRYMTENRNVKKFESRDETWLFFLLSVLQAPSSVGHHLKETAGKYLLLASSKERARFLLAMYQGFRNLPDALFEEDSGLPDILDYLKKVLSRVYHAELFEDPRNKMKKKHHGDI